MNMENDQDYVDQEDKRNNYGSSELGGDRS
jgi:hypothetical protein